MKYEIIKRGSKFWLYELKWRTMYGRRMTAAEIYDRCPLDFVAVGRKKDLVALCKENGYELI